MENWRIISLSCLSAWLSPLARGLGLGGDCASARDLQFFIRSITFTLLVLGEGSVTADCPTSVPRGGRFCSMSSQDGCSSPPSSDQSPCSSLTCWEDSDFSQSLSSSLTCLQKPFLDSRSCVIFSPGNILCSISGGMGGGCGRRGGSPLHAHLASASCLMGRGPEVTVWLDLNSTADSAGRSGAWAWCRWRLTLSDSRTSSVVLRLLPLPGGDRGSTGGERWGTQERVSHRPWGRMLER